MIIGILAVLLLTLILPQFLKFPKLKVLDLTGLWWIETTRALRFASACCPSLATWKLLLRRNEEIKVECLVAEISESHTIEELFVGKECVSYEPQELTCSSYWSSLLFLKRLHLENSFATEKKLLGQILSQLPCLEELSLRAQGDFILDGIITEDLVCLRRLKVSQQLSRPLWDQLLAHAPNLTRIKSYWNVGNLSTVPTGICGRLAKYSHNLERMTLVFGSHHNGDLSDLFRKCTKIKRLNIRVPHLIAGAFVHIHFLKDSLKYLILDVRGLTSVDLSSISQCYGLKKLSITANSSLDTLSPGTLGALPLLEELNLSYKATRVDLTELLNSARFIKTLALTGDGYIRDDCATLAKLENLRMQGLSDGNAKKIETFLGHSPNLKRVEIAGPPSWKNPTTAHAIGEMIHAILLPRTGILEEVTILSNGNNEVATALQKLFLDKVLLVRDTKRFVDNAHFHFKIFNNVK